MLWYCICLSGCVMVSAVDEVQNIITVVYQYFTLVVFCLRNIRPSDVQYVYSRPLYFSSASCFTSSVRYLVRFSVMKILSGWFCKLFLLLYTLLRVLYEMNLTITWDFPSFTFPIICHDDWALYLWTLYRCCFLFFYFFAFVYVYTRKVYSCTTFCVCVHCTPVELFPHWYIC